MARIKKLLALLDADSISRLFRDAREQGGAKSGRGMAETEDKDVLS